MFKNILTTADKHLTACAAPSCIQPKQSTRKIKCCGQHCNNFIHLDCCGFARDSFKREVDTSALLLQFKCNTCTSNDNMTTLLAEVRDLLASNDNNIKQINTLLSRQSTDLNNTVAAMDEDGEKLCKIDSKVDTVVLRLQRLEEKINNLELPVRDNLSSQSQNQPSSSVDLTRASTKLENMILDLERKLTSTSSADDSQISKIDKGLSSLTSTLQKRFENLEATQGGLLAQHTVINSLAPSIQTISKSLSDINDCLQNLKLPVPIDSTRPTQSLNDELTLAKTLPSTGWRQINDGSKLVWKQQWPPTERRPDSSARRGTPRPRKRNNIRREELRNKTHDKNPTDIDRLDEIIEQVDSTHPNPHSNSQPILQTVPTIDLTTSSQSDSDNPRSSFKPPTRPSCPPPLPPSYHSAPGLKPPARNPIPRVNAAPQPISRPLCPSKPAPGAQTLNPTGRTNSPIPSLLDIEVSAPATSVHALDPISPVFNPNSKTTNPSLYPNFQRGETINPTPASKPADTKPHDSPANPPNMSLHTSAPSFIDPLCTPAARLTAMSAKTDGAYALASFNNSDIYLRTRQYLSFFHNQRPSVCIGSTTKLSLQMFLLSHGLPTNPPDLKALFLKFHNRGGNFNVPAKVIEADLEALGLSLSQERTRQLANSNAAFNNFYMRTRKYNDKDF